MTRSGRRRDDPPHDGRETRQSGAAHLKAAIARIVQRTGLATRPPDPGAPEPTTDYEGHVAQQLAEIKQHVTSQNRLLLFTLLSVFAELVYELATRP